MLNNDLPVLTVRALNEAYAELVERLADYNGIHGDALHARLDAIYTELHARAGRENIARSMTTDDLQDMLPDFEQVAALCGIRPEQARLNRVIVIAELRRRGIEVNGRREPFTLDEVQAENALDEYMRGDPNA